MEEFGRNWSEFLKKALDNVTDDEKIPCRHIMEKNILVPFFKRTVVSKLSGHQANVSQHEAIYERVHGNQLRNVVSISEEQFRFVKGKSTTGAIFTLRQLQERYRE